MRKDTVVAADAFDPVKWLGKPVRDGNTGEVVGIVEVAWHRDDGAVVGKCRMHKGAVFEAVLFAPNAANEPRSDSK